MYKKINLEDWLNDQADSMTDVKLQEQCYMAAGWIIKHGSSNVSNRYTLMQGGMTAVDLRQLVYDVCDYYGDGFDATLSDDFDYIFMA